MFRRKRRNLRFDQEVRVGIVYKSKLEMSGVQDQLEIKFRLIDGTDIGPKSFPVAASVANLKESILAQWPKGNLSLLFFFRQLIVCLCVERYYTGSNSLNKLYRMVLLPFHI